MLFRSDYVNRYGEYGGTTGIDGAMDRNFWSNVTMSPDLPSVATVAADLYAQSGGQPVDGVIVADPFALRGIINLTGPLTVTGTDTVLNASNVLQYLLFDQYFRDSHVNGQYRDPNRDIADQAIKALLSTDLPSPVVIARSLGGPISGGHLMMWSLRPEDQPLRVLQLARQRELLERLA